MKKLMMMFLALAALCGCATQKTWQPVGGSRADAVVRLAFDFGPFEVPEVNEAQALQAAGERCRAWGYPTVEAFAGVTRTCAAPSGFGCDRWRVTREFQCTGGTTQQR